jgi:hypothetical protein
MSHTPAFTGGELTTSAVPLEATTAFVLTSEIEDNSKFVALRQPVRVAKTPAARKK